MSVEIQRNVCLRPFSHHHVGIINQPLPWLLFYPGSRLSNRRSWHLRAVNRSLQFLSWNLIRHRKYCFCRHRRRTILRRIVERSRLVMTWCHSSRVALKWAHLQIKVMTHNFFFAFSDKLGYFGYGIWFLVIYYRELAGWKWWVREGKDVFHVFFDKVLFFDVTFKRLRAISSAHAEGAGCTSGHEVGCLGYIVLACSQAVWYLPPLERSLQVYLLSIIVLRLQTQHVFRADSQNLLSLIQLVISTASRNCNFAAPISIPIPLMPIDFIRIHLPVERYRPLLLRMCTSMFAFINAWVWHIPIVCFDTVHVDWFLSFPLFLSTQRHTLCQIICRMNERLDLLRGLTVAW